LLLVQGVSTPHEPEVDGLGDDVGDVAEVVGVGVGVVGVGLGATVVEAVGDGASEVGVFVFVGVTVGVGLGVPPFAAMSCLFGSGRLGWPAR
jgi:hypothetical protein